MSEEKITQEQTAPAERRGSLLSYGLVWLRDLTLSFIIAGIVILFIYQPVEVEGTSMEPTLQNQERIFINKFTYRFGLEKIGRGDMVVFWADKNVDPGKSYIKRVIGLPGETVWIDKGIIYVNGQRLQDYVPKAYVDHKSISEPMKLKSDEYYVLGDHRSSSNDSRAWGAVKRSAIYGKAVFVYWPPAKIGPVK
jgi:signal peptidase I